MEAREEYVTQALSKHVQDSLAAFSVQCKMQELAYSSQQQQSRKSEQLQWLQVETPHEALHARLKTQLLLELEDEGNKKRVQDAFAKGNGTLIDLELRNEADLHSRQQWEARLQWDSAWEGLFQESRREKMAMLRSEARSSDFVEVALVPILRAMRLEESVTALKEALVTRHLEGERLTSEESRFVAQHSALLLQHLDRAYLQAVFERLAPGVLQHAEWLVAERILRKHRAIMDRAKGQRLRHLAHVKEVAERAEREKKALILRAQSERREHEGFMVQRERELRQLKKIQLKFAAKVAAMEKKNHFKIRNPIVVRFCQKLLQRCNIPSQGERNAARANSSAFELRNYPKAREKPLFELDNEPLTASIVKRLFHPASQLLLNRMSEKKKHGADEEDIKSANGDDQTQSTANITTTVVTQKLSKNQPLSVQARYLQELASQRQKFRQERIPLRGMAIRDAAKHSAQFYSAGPMRERPLQSVVVVEQKSQSKSKLRHLYYGDDPDDVHLPFRNNWVNRQVEARAATLIQHAYRAWKQKKGFRKVMKEVNEKKGRAIDNRVRKYVQAKNLLQSARPHRMSAPILSHASNQSPVLQSHVASSTEVSDAVTSALKQAPKRRLSTFHDASLAAKSTQHSRTPSQQSVLESQSKKIFAHQRAQTLAIGSNTTFETRSVSTAATNAALQQGKNQHSASFYEVTGFRTPQQLSSATADKYPKSPSSNSPASGIRKPQGRVTRLEIKHKKLLQCVRNKNLTGVLISGFIYYEGRDVNIRDAIGNCPLYYAAANGDLPFVQWLLDMQADVNFLCKDGNTPLHAAFRTGDQMLVLKLLDAGGDLTLVNTQRQTPNALASLKLLKTLGLEDAIAYSYPQQDDQSQGSSDEIAKMLPRATALRTAQTHKIRVRKLILKEDGVPALQNVTQIDNNKYWHPNQRFCVWGDNEFYDAKHQLTYFPVSMNNPNDSLQKMNTEGTTKIVAQYLTPEQRQTEMQLAAKREQILFEQQKLRNAQK